jgi:hypothetical protein
MAMLQHSTLPKGKIGYPCCRDLSAGAASEAANGITICRKLPLA